MRRWLCLLPLLLAGCGGGNGSPSASVSPSGSVLASAIAKPTVAPTAVPTPTVVQNVYTVKEGDTLSRIASQNNTSIDAISKANDISDPNKLQVGQKLVLPAGASGAPAASGSTSTLPPAASKPPPP
jgi:LysM repeat protein